MGHVKYGYRQQRQERSEVLKATKTDGLPLDIKDKLLQPLGDQLKLILTYPLRQMTVNFQGHGNVRSYQYLQIMELETTNKKRWQESDCNN